MQLQVGNKVSTLVCWIFLGWEGNEETWHWFPGYSLQGKVELPNKVQIILVVHVYCV